MEKYEEIKKGFLDNGFVEKDEGCFVFEMKKINTMNINGQIVKKEIKDTIEVVYSGSGGEIDDSDVCMDNMFFFDIFHNGEKVIGVGVTGFDEIAEMLNIK